MKRTLITGALCALSLTAGAYAGPATSSATIEAPAPFHVRQFLEIVRQDSNLYVDVHSVAHHPRRIGLTIQEADPVRPHQDARIRVDYLTYRDAQRMGAALTSYGDWLERRVNAHR